ncbi:MULTISPECIES: hypothetical protein [Actinomadura]|uniref:Secreted protein n=1 Tax=Actinomadura yumaensis TaxID=111807 RepID=A0ABW2CEQ7_9ACTN|nr:hypothetical protein [Actinomadura sp. J1-007]MWK34686.1 hypothetical protein [Actinomadura sp. J1-007]
MLKTRSWAAITAAAAAVALTAVPASAADQEGRIYCTSGFRVGHTDFSFSADGCEPSVTDYNSRFFVETLYFNLTWNHHVRVTCEPPAVATSPSSWEAYSCNFG